MMRRLYVKILLTWLVALVVTMALVFGLFIFVSGDSHRYYVVKSVGATTVMVRDFLETAVAAAVQQGAAEDAALRSAVRRVGATTLAGVWVSGPAGATITASLPGADRAPVLAGAKPAPFADAAVYVNIGPGRRSYAIVPLRLPAGNATLHVLTQRDPGRFPHGTFALGLALIGIAVAGIAIPLTRQITKPLQRLQGSVRRIQQGDLTARAEVAGADEIGRLGAAFNDMAETVERMVKGGKELTANISHELRSPLARIRIAGECLQEAMARGDQADAAEMLAAIWSDIDEADRMIGRILEFSKLDLHEPLPVTAPVRVAGLLEGLMKALGPQVRSRGLVVTMELEPEIMVAGDAEWLRTAGKNLLENAVRHAPEGGAVRVVWRAAGGVARLEVTNTFSTLDPTELVRIFDPFYRGSGTTSEGTGLGLAITKKIVTLHHGEIGAQNTPAGFQVWLHLPILGGQDTAPEV